MSDLTKARFREEIRIQIQAFHMQQPEIFLYSMEMETGDPQFCYLINHWEIMHFQSAFKVSELPSLGNKSCPSKDAFHFLVFVLYIWSLLIKIVLMISTFHR